MNSVIWQMHRTVNDHVKTLIKKDWVLNSENPIWISKSLAQIWRDVPCFHVLFISERHFYSVNVKLLSYPPQNKHCCTSAKTTKPSAGYQEKFPLSFRVIQQGICSMGLTTQTAKGCLEGTEYFNAQWGTWASVSIILMLLDLNATLKWVELLSLKHL